MDRYSKTSSRLLLLAVILCAVCVHCDPEWSRDKRSDDHGPLEAVVSGHRQQVTSLWSKLTAIQNQITSLQTQTVTKLTPLQNQTKFDLCTRLQDCKTSPRSLLLVILCAACVHRDTEWSRDKRSDDHGPLETVVSRLSQQVTSLEAQLTAMGTKVTALQNQHNQLQTKFDASQKQVAFVARNSADPFNVAAAGTLVYNVADINLGGGFDTVTGVFTAPTSGLYVFSISCMDVKRGQDEDIGVLVDGNRVCGCFSNSQEFSIMGYGLASVHLNAGQRAWVHLYRDSSRNVAGWYGNTFVGFLVKTDD